MKRVIIESPFAGPDQATIERNLRYLRACMRDCLLRDEAPFANHALYTQPGVLADANSEERNRGINASFAWRQAAELTVVYTDLGISRGMQAGIDHARESCAPIEFRSLPEWKSQRLTDLLSRAAIAIDAVPDPSAADIQLVGELRAAAAECTPAPAPKPERWGVFAGDFLAHGQITELRSLNEALACDPAQEPGRRVARIVQNAAGDWVEAK